jgi:glycogen debranching enzyme
MTLNSLWTIGFETIKELEVDTGILASGKNEIYGCIFGRDTLITSLQLINVYKRTQDTYFLHVVKKALTHLLTLQGKEVNVQSGEEPGKCIHEYRPTQHEHLTKRAVDPWYVYPDGVMRNYDTVDATPLLLIALYRYYQVSGDEAFITQHESNIRAALNWLTQYGDSNHDGFIDYRVPEGRVHGGSTGHSWMDSHDSVFHEDGAPISEPIAPVEVQAYTYLAYRLWSSYFPEYKHEFTIRAQTLKTQFNKRFVRAHTDGLFLASAIDGNGKPIDAVRSSMGHCLWASLNPLFDLERDCIIAEEHIPRIVERLLQPDMYHPKAGIRTLSSRSSHFAPNSYHNGSFWPHDTNIIAQGLAYCDYIEQAEQVQRAFLYALEAFQTPIELFCLQEENYTEWKSESQSSCKKQAWSAAAILCALAPTQSLHVTNPQ